jgi:hypothetical protein
MIGMLRVSSFFEFACTVKLSADSILLKRLNSIYNECEPIEIEDRHMRRKLYEKIPIEHINMLSSRFSLSCDAAFM